MYKEKQNRNEMKDVMTSAYGWGLGCMIYISPCMWNKKWGNWNLFSQSGILETLSSAIGPVFFKHVHAYGLGFINLDLKVYYHNERNAV
ncbi:hypothetical protein Peur_037518 [Populus x canadensis]